MIKKIRKKYLAWENTIWVRLHFDELLADYCNQIILVSHCKVVDSTPNFGELNLNMQSRTLMPVIWYFCCLTGKKRRGVFYNGAFYT